MIARHLNLQTRGIILVALPLVCQLILMASLTFLLRSENDESVKEERTKNIIGLSQDLTAMCGNALSDIIKPTRPHEFPQGEALQQSLDKFIGEAREVQELASQENDSQVKKSADKLVDYSTEFCEVIKQGVEARLQDVPNPGRVLIQYKGALIGQKYMVEAEKIADIEMRKVNASPFGKEEWRNSMKAVLLFALIFSCALALGLAKLYGANISVPMSRLAENARRLSNRQPLLPELDGDDEFANLDRHFHEVDQSVGQALASQVALVNNAADVICSLNREGRIEKINPFSENLLGYKEEELVGKSISEIAKGEIHFNLDGATQNFETQLIAKNGHCVDVRCSAYWSERDQKVFCVIHDVTQQKNLDRLKEQFISMISSDLRSPLTAILDQIKLLTETAHDDISEAALQELSSAEQNCNRLIFLVDDLLDFEKIQGGKLNLKFTECRVKNLIAESAQMVDGFAKRHGITIEVGEEDAFIQCDAAKIRQVIINLLSNGIKFSPDNSKLAVCCKQDKDAVEIEVTDEGAGIPEEDRERIFAAFDQSSFTESSKLAGSGLGLSICRMIVQAHHGTIGIKNGTEKGTTFWFRLPFDQKQKKS